MADFGYELKGREVYLWLDDKNDFRQYKVSLKNKNREGKTEYMNVEISLPKDCPEYPNKTLISFDGFPTFRTYKNAADKVVYVPRIVATKVWQADGNTPTYADPDRIDSYEQLDKKVKDAFSDMPDIAFNEVTDDIPF